MNLPRFSLRSLLLAACLAAAAFGLWWRWEPWFRERKLLVHGPSVERVEISSDEHRIATASTGNTVKIWDIITGELLTILKDHKNFEKPIISGRESRVIHEAPYGPAIPRSISIKWSANDSQIISAGTDGTVRLWDVDTGRLLNISDSSENIPLPMHIFSQQGGRVAIANANGHNILITNEQYTEILCLLSGHNDFVGHISFFNDGNGLVSASEDSTIGIWRRRRPEYWWGIAWLWEFWATLLLATALAGSLARDWRRLGSGPVGPAEAKGVINIVDSQSIQQVE